MLRFGIACVLSAACSLSQAACYSVYDGGGVLLLRSEYAPVDLQHRIGDVVPAKFGVGPAWFLLLTMACAMRRMGQAASRLPVGVPSIQWLRPQ